MQFLVYYLILHLCVSMHACNSRHLGVFHKESTGEEFSLVITSKIPELMSELDGRHVNEDNIKQNESELEVSHVLKMREGSDVKVQVSQGKNKIEEWKNHGRLTMESKPKDSKEAINETKDNGFTEDVVVMDYAQPHRKPPIHNIEP